YTPSQIEGAIGTVFGVDTQLIRDGTYFVAESGGAIVGCGGWSRRKALFGSDRGKSEEDSLLDPSFEPARIRAFFVHPDFARRGIGQALLEASEQAALAAGFNRIDIVATLTGEPLYRKFGYSVVERYELQLVNQEKLPVVRLAKSLARPG
ncbi:MAG: GNAT family N-acetyltransferase, partial [Akkermansiaceae bacterium]|nr:GNAT family N-acetyltransferase [Verrucomicrobiales bacterium]